jgi:NDP-sugar pyrophosphorylase family protein
MVRVSGLIEQMIAGVQTTSDDGLTPEQALLAINGEVEALTADQQDRWRKLRQAIEAAGITVLAPLDLLDEDFIVTYGDSYVDLDLAELTRFHRQSKLPATMSIFKNDGQWDKSNVRMRSPHKILYEQTPHVQSMFIDYGASVISRTKFEALAPGGAWELPRFFEALSESNELGGFLVKNRFFEIGSTIGLNEFRNIVGERESN